MPPKDPYRAFNFTLEIGAITRAGFMECSGFGAENTPIEYREGGENTTVRKLPGVTKYPNIVLKWGISDDRDLIDWFSDVTQGKIQRLDGSIVLRDLDGTEKLRWNFVRAWPTKWTGPSLNAKGTEVAIDTLELAHEGVGRA
jgi:phage tail-like protein